MIVAAVIGTLVIGILGSNLLRSASTRALFHANRDKAEVIRKLQSLRLPHDSIEAKALCTRKGLGVWTAMQQQMPEASAGFTIAGFRNSGDLCDVAMVRDTIEGVSRVHVRLICAGTQWRFEDIYCSELQGRRMDLWASDAVEHPFLAAAKFHKPEIVAATKEVIGAVKGTAEFARDVSFLIKALKGN
jgi:acetone carboxylase gamma subunit